MQPNASQISFQSKATPLPAIGEPVLRRSSLLSFFSVSSVLIQDHYLNFKCLDSHHQEYYQKLLILHTYIIMFFPHTLSPLPPPHPPPTIFFYTSSSLCASRFRLPPPSFKKILVGTNMVCPLKCKYYSANTIVGSSI